MSDPPAALIGGYDPVSGLVLGSSGTPLQFGGTGGQQALAGDQSWKLLLWAGIAPNHEKICHLCMSALLAAAVASGAVSGWQWRQQVQQERAHAAALAAARQLATSFVSISAGTVDRDIASIAAGATGEFQAEFTAGSAQVRDFWC